MEEELLAQLAAAAAEGDGGALAELVRLTQPTVWRVCAALGSGDDVEDLVQETYLRALKSLPTYRRDAPVRVWLLAVARNVCADQVRRRQRQRRLLERVTRLTDFESRPSTVGDDSTDLLRFLDPDRREAFVLTQVIGLSYEEAAAVADCAVGTIRSRVARARAELVEAVRLAEAR